VRASLTLGLVLLAGAAGCAATRDRCRIGDTPPWNCVAMGETGPLCRDGYASPVCADSAWTCFGGLVPDHGACRCFDVARPATQHCECGDAGIACTFDCGELRCDLANEYCAVTASDTGGPDTHACVPWTSPCTGTGCACIAGGSSACMEEVGAVTARYPGG
jgi:hypothetical protein